jgi:hypothetical protein
MALNCPNCGAEIPAENINIQKMAALCSTCNHVFAFSADSGTGPKYKRRKLKKPRRLTLEGEGDRLEMSYTRVFDQNAYGALAGLGFAALLFTFAFFAVAFSPDAPSPVLILPGAIMAVVWYLLLVLLTTVTGITADRQSVAIKTGPLPFPNAEDKSLDVDEISRVYCEETAGSQKNQSGNRYYRVSAELIDGTQVTLLKSLPQEYAFYIAQTLEAHLNALSGFVASLSDGSTHDNSDAVPLAHLFAGDEAEGAERSD